MVDFSDRRQSLFDMKATEAKKLAQQNQARTA
jgi:hypothetical protein